MKQILFIITCSIIGLLILFFFLVLICFLLVFYSPTKSAKALQKIDTPSGKVYKPFLEEMVNAVKHIRTLNHLNFTIDSYDGLKLKGKYYEFSKGAPIELMMHGYKGSGERDLSVGVLRSAKQGRNVLVVDQRSRGHSQGHITTFGVKESIDCIYWVNHIIETFGKDVKIILTGISMGASTVLLAASKNDLPANVIGVIADCGYTSAEEIIKKVLKQINLPVKLFYPIIYLGARMFGRFDLNDANALKAIKNCKVPVVFLHGDTDDFVPCEMSKRLYEACPSKKLLHITKGAGHGLSYPVDKQGYLDALSKFISLCEV